MTEELEPNEIYIQLGENRIGTEICLRRWQETPFEGGIKYTHALPKMQKVDLDGMSKKPFNRRTQFRNGIVLGYNSAIDDIKAKYGELYAEADNRFLSEAAEVK